MSSYPLAGRVGGGHRAKDAGLQEKVHVFGFRSVG